MYLGLWDMHYVRGECNVVAGGVTTLTILQFKLIRIFVEQVWEYIFMLTLHLLIMYPYYDMKAFRSDAQWSCSSMKDYLTSDFSNIRW